MSTHDPSKCIQRPEAALVAEADGIERVEILLPIVSIRDEIWNAAFAKAANALAREIHRRGGHGRSRNEVRTCFLAHLDPAAMSHSFGRNFLALLKRHIRDHLEIDLDIRLKRLDANESGLMKVIMLTVRPCDAATIFNCVAWINTSGHVEQMRGHTGAIRSWEWGLIFDWFVSSLNKILRKRSDVYYRLFRELDENGALRNAMIAGLDQVALMTSLYGENPWSPASGDAARPALDAGTLDLEESVKIADFDVLQSPREAGLDEGNRVPSWSRKR